MRSLLYNFRIPLKIKTYIQNKFKVMLMLCNWFTFWNCQLVLCHIGCVSFVLSHFGICVPSIIWELFYFRNSSKILIELIGHVTNPTRFICCFSGWCVNKVVTDHLNHFIKSLLTHKSELVLFYNMILYYLYLIRERSRFKKTFI